MQYSLILIKVLVGIRIEAANIVEILFVVAVVVQVIIFLRINIRARVIAKNENVHYVGGILNQKIDGRSLRIKKCVTIVSQDAAIRSRVYLLMPSFLLLHERHITLSYRRTAAVVDQKLHHCLKRKCSLSVSFEGVINPQNIASSRFDSISIV